MGGGGLLVNIFLRVDIFSSRVEIFSRGLRNFLRWLRNFFERGLINFRGGGVKNFWVEG